MHVQVLASSSAGQKRKGTLILDQGLRHFKGPDSKCLRCRGPHRTVSLTAVRLCYCSMKAAVEQHVNKQLWLLPSKLFISQDRQQGCVLTL